MGFLNTFRIAHVVMFVLRSNMLPRLKSWDIAPMCKNNDAVRRYFTLAAVSTCTPLCRCAMMCLYLRHQALGRSRAGTGGKHYQQLFALIKNPKYVKMCPPEKRAAIRIEQYCKRRKDRMKPKWQEDSSCVFACCFCRGTCHRRDTAGKENAPKSLWRRSGKRGFAKSR